MGSGKATRVYDVVECLAVVFLTSWWLPHGSIPQLRVVLVVHMDDLRSGIGAGLLVMQHRLAGQNGAIASMCRSPWT